MEVAMWLCVPFQLGRWCSLDLVPNYVVLNLGHEGGRPHHRQSCHTRGLWIGVRKLVVLTLNIQLRVIIFFFSLYLCLAQRLIWIYMFYVNHIAVCMWHGLKCWFQHPLPYITTTTTNQIPIIWHSIPSQDISSNDGCHICVESISYNCYYVSNGKCVLDSTILVVISHTS